jgi:hypothetical protein
MPTEERAEALAIAFLKSQLPGQTRLHHTLTLSGVARLFKPGTPGAARLKTNGAMSAIEKIGPAARMTGDGRERRFPAELPAIDRL